MTLVISAFTKLNGATARTTNVNTLLPRLKAIDPKAKIYTGCQSYCGPGRDRAFVFVNNKPILATNEDELIAKVKEFLGK